VCVYVCMCVHVFVLISGLQLYLGVAKNDLRTASRILVRSQTYHKMSCIRLYIEPISIHIIISLRNRIII